MNEKPAYEELEKKVQELERAVSQHEAAEATLHQQAQILASIQDTIVIITPEMKTIYANGPAKELFGDKPEMFREPCYRFFKHRDEICEGCPVLKSLEDEQPHKAVLKSYDRNGKGMWRLNMAFPFYDRDGDVIAGLEIITDYTLEKKAEAVLKESEERFRALFENMGDGVAIYEAVDSGADFIFVDFNRAGEQIDNISKDALMGKRVTEVFLGVKEFGLLEVLKRVWKTGQSEHHPITEYKDERITGWRDSFIYKLPTGEVVAIYSDETDRVQSEKALREALLRQKEAIKAGNVGLWDWDLKNNRVYYSKEWKRQIGYEENEIKNDFEEWQSRVHPDDLAPTLQKVNQSIAGKKLEHKVEFRFRHKDGSYRWILAQASILQDESGNPVRMLGSHIDITDRKRDEEALNQRVEFERLISQISSHFINLNPDDADEGINNALASIGTFTGADRAYIFQYKAGGTAKMDNTHEWCAEGIEPQIENLKDITLEKELPWFLERILGREALHVPDVKSLPPEAHLEREHFESQDIQSLVVVPMVFRDQDIGFLGFDSVRARRAWTAEEAGLLKLVGETITHTIISKRNELALRKSEEEFRQVYEHMAIGVARVSLDYLIEAANDAYCSMLGYSEKELIGKHLKDITHPEILDENLSKQSQLARGEIDHFRMDKTFIHKNGSVLYGILDANLIRNVDGKPSYFIGSALDITDRKKAEDALRESEEKYRLLVENADEAIFIAQDDIIKFPNPKTLELTGYSEEELATTPFAEFIHSEDRQMVVERYRRRLNGESPPSDYAFRIINKSNSVLWVQNNVAPTTWDGRPATINLLRDITEKRRLEEQLSQSEKLEAIATLTGGIAHDYNNLLSIIVGNLGLARQDAKPGSEQAQFLNEAEKAVRKVGDLTHELMALSRGGGPIKELGPIRELLMASADVISADSGITVNVSIQGDLWPVPHDSRKMATVFRNVVQNALEAMPAGGEFTIQARNLLVEDGDAVPGSPVKPGNYVRIQFRDNGKGIPDEYLDKIYDPYFSTKPMGVQKGMGLGLATAHAIVKKHGGEIIVESTPDAGATVNIYLPAQPEEGDGEDGKPVSSATQSTVADRQAPMGRILLMDDEEMLRNLAKQMLNRLGYEVKTVKDGIEAIEVYRKQLGSANPFDAVILDLTIKGGMGGEQALRELLKIDPDVNAIVASGYFNDPVMTDFHDYGFKGAMAKPYEMKDLRGAIKKVL